MEFPSTDPLGRFFSNIKEFGLESINLFYGRYRAYVEDIEEGAEYGRIKVRVPMLGHKEGMWIWAYPKFPTPCGKVGDDGYYGMYVPPPDIGTTVWVEFEGGRTKHCIYTGGWFPKGALPDKVKDASPYIWSFWSRAQHYLTFRDKEGEEEVELAWMGKHKITMDEDHLIVTTEGGTSVELKTDGTLVIKDENDNQIETSGEGTEVTAGTAKVILHNGTAEIHAKEFVWGPGGVTSGAKPVARGEDLVKVLRDLTTILQNFKVVGSGITAATDPSTIAQLVPITTRLQKTLVQTFKV